MSLEERLRRYRPSCPCSRTTRTSYPYTGSRTASLDESCGWTCSRPLRITSAVELDALAELQASEAYY
jgi:hypothetical protein